MEQLPILGEENISIEKVRIRKWIDRKTGKQKFQRYINLPKKSKILAGEYIKYKKVEIK